MTVIKYENSLGQLTLSGKGKGALRLLEIEGLESALREYTVASYPGQSGQETLSARALPRTITLAVEILKGHYEVDIHRILDIIQEPGLLFVESEDLSRRIFCSQSRITDIKRIVKGEISTFAVQFVCDSPYFEDAEDTVVPLYKRTKGLSTPFTLPRSFGDIVAGGVVENKGSIPIEPIITIYYPSALEGIDGITLKNETTGKGISLEYSPSGEDTVVIDVKNRKITSRIAGSLLNNLSDDTFLGDFTLERGKNELSVDLGDVAKGFGIECKFSNLYGEAVIC